MNNNNDRSYSSYRAGSADLSETGVKEGPWVAVTVDPKGRVTDRSDRPFYYSCKKFSSNRRMIADIWNSLESFYSLEPVSKEFQPYILNLKPIVGFISKPEQQGEKKMSNITDSVTRKVYNIDLSILAALVGSEQDDLATLLGSDHVTGSNPELKAALEEMAAEEKRAKIKAAAQEIRKVLEATTAVKTSLVEAIRSARREEAKALDRIRKIEQATAYASETMDYRPMVALLLGQDSIELPKEWLDKQTAGVKSGGKSNRPAGKK